MERPGADGLRRAAFAASVLDDLDLTLEPAGVRLERTLVAWAELAAAAGGQAADEGAALRRVRALLLARHWCARTRPGGLAARVVPAGLPAGHALHPGAGWTRAAVRGGVVQLGLAAQHLDPADADRAVLLPPTAVLEAGLDADALWRAAAERLEQLGAVAADRAAADRRGVLRPCAGTNVVGLLGAASLRAALAAREGGMATAAVPMLDRGWTRLSLVDPAFGAAAAAATPQERRGFDRPLLITRDEVVQAPPGGAPQAALGAR